MPELRVVVVVMMLALKGKATMTPEKGNVRRRVEVCL